MGEWGGHRPRNAGSYQLWCWRRLLRVPWTARWSNRSTLKEINPEYSLEGLMAEDDAPILWPPDVKSWLIRKDPDAGKDWGQGEKGVREDETIGWHHQFNGHEFEQTFGDGEGQESLACWSTWGLRVGHKWVPERQPGAGRGKGGFSPRVSGGRVALPAPRFPMSQPLSCDRINLLFHDTHTPVCDMHSSSPRKWIDLAILSPLHN